MAVEIIQTVFYSLTLKHPLKDHNGVVSGILGFCTFMDYEALVFCLKLKKNNLTHLNIAEVTVNFHLNNIKDKWQCFSREGIFEKALQKGLFGFSGIWDLLKTSSNLRG